MNVSFTFIDFQAALEEFRQQIGADHRFDGCENHLILPKALGEGQVSRVKLRDGLDLLVNKHLLDEGLTLEFSDDSSTSSLIALKFCLSGPVSGTIQGVNTHLRLSSGSHCLLYCPERIGKVEFAARTKICTVELGITPEIFKTLIDEEHYPAGFQQMLDMDSVAPYWEFRRTNSLMAIALQQILQCPYQGATRRLYLESKGLELIALYLGQLEANQLEPPKSFKLKPEDISRIHQAKDILIRRIDNPPSLLSLARQVGINDCKLKKGFRQVFGASVFGYLHNHRMEMAAQLLQENQMTVTAVASAVGFANRGSFAAAFRRKFGVNPSDYLAAYRKQYWTIDPKTPVSDRKNSG